MTIVAPTAVQLDWKKHAEKPFGPGALSGWIAKTYFLTSSAEGNAVRVSFVSGDIHGFRAFETIADPSDPLEVKIAWSILRFERQYDVLQREVNLPSLPAHWVYFWLYVPLQQHGKTQCFSRLRSAKEGGFQQVWGYLGYHCIFDHCGRHSSI